ncbi:COX assembly mitochondrial protein homolog [Cavia porcellus]
MLSRDPLSQPRSTVLSFRQLTRLKQQQERLQERLPLEAGVRDRLHFRKATQGVTAAPTQTSGIAALDCAFRHLPRPERARGHAPTLDPSFGEGALFHLQDSGRGQQGAGAKGSGSRNWRRKEEKGLHCFAEPAVTFLLLPREEAGVSARPGSSLPRPLPGSPGQLPSVPAEMALDPADQHLRHVEKDVLIPKIMREKAKERCSEQVQDFTKCCKDSGLLMVIKCRKENSALKECLTAYYNDPAFYEECKMEYLNEREEFRRTGIPSKKRLQKLPTSM